MTWYRTGTVTVTNGSANVTLAGGDALQNIFPDDGFVGPDGRTYAVNTIGGAGAFTLQTPYQGVNAAGAAYLIIPTADYVQLRDLLEATNTLITAYQDIALAAGVGRFAPGVAASPGVRGVGHEGTGLVWNDDETLSISVAGTIVATFGANSLNFMRGTDGDSFVTGKTGGQILRIFANADTIGLFNVAGAGGERDGIRITDDAVSVDIDALEAGKFGNNANPCLLLSKNYGAPGHLLTGLRVTLNGGAGGAYLGGYNLETNYSHNCEFVNGNAWVARHTFAGRFTSDVDGFKWFVDSGLTAGAPYSPVERMRLTMDGRLAIGSIDPQKKFVVSNGGANGFEVEPADGYYTRIISYDRAGATYTPMYVEGSEVRFMPGGANMGYVNSTGLGVNVAPSHRLTVLSNIEIARFITTTVRGAGSAFIGIADPSGRKGYWGYGGGNDVMQVANELNAGLQFGVNGGLQWEITSAANLEPVNDNARNLAAAAKRIVNSYFVVAPTVTSDEREKTWRGAPSKAELKAATRIMTELGFYQWNHSIEEKGNEARLHFGVRAQRVWAIMADEGLIDPIGEDGRPGKTPYAFLCFDEWGEEKEPIMADRTVKAKFKGRGKNRREIEPEHIERYATGKMRVTLEAGNRFGLRETQLHGFLIAAQQFMIEENDRRLTALEERLKQ